MKEFVKAQKEDSARSHEDRRLNRIDGEAMFVGSIVHSADHFMASTMDATKILSSNCFFSGNAEALRIIIPFITDQNLFLNLFYDPRAKFSHKPWFRAAYQAAAAIDTQI